MPKTIKTTRKLSPAQRAAITRAQNKQARIAAAEAERARFASLSAGQKAAETKRANGTHLSAAAKAAETKRQNKLNGDSKPASVKVADDTSGMVKALRLAQQLIAAGLV